MRLVLFDIDGTLLNSGGMGRAAMQKALGQIFGSPGNPSYRYDGKTDKQIVREVMKMEGHSDAHIDSRMEKLVEVYLDGLREAAKSGRFNIRPLDGIPEILDALEARYPVLRGAIRDQTTRQRRALVRFFACEQDLSLDPPDRPLPDAVVTGKEPFLIIGAMAGG